MHAGRFRTSPTGISSPLPATTGAQQRRHQRSTTCGAWPSRSSSTWCGHSWCGCWCVVGGGTGCVVVQRQGVARLPHARRPRPPFRGGSDTHRHHRCRGAARPAAYRSATTRPDALVRTSAAHLARHAFIRDLPVALADHRAGPPPSHAPGRTASFAAVHRCLTRARRSLVPVARTADQARHRLGNGKPCRHQYGVIGGPGHGGRRSCPIGRWPHRHVRHRGVGSGRFGACIDHRCDSGHFGRVDAHCRIRTVSTIR